MTRVSISLPSESYRIVADASGDISSVFRSGAELRMPRNMPTARQIARISRAKKLPRQTSKVMTAAFVFRRTDLDDTERICSCRPFFP